MRTIVAPLAPEVRLQLEALDGQLRGVAEGYIARLRLEPYLGRVISRGLLGRVGARAVLFNRDARPEQMVGDHRGRLRVADEGPEKGPRWRVIYRLREAPAAGVLVVQVLSVGPGHTDTGVEDAYDMATRLVAALLEHEQRRKR